MVAACSVCNQERLIFEFQRPCEECHTISTRCLGCPVVKCGTHGCSNDCFWDVEHDGETVSTRTQKQAVAEYKALLCAAFEDKPGKAEDGHIRALKVNGEEVDVPVSGNELLEDIKQKIAGHFKCDWNKIKLFHDGQEVSASHWSEAGVPSGACVQVILQMWSQKSKPVDELMFDLSWQCSGLTRYLNGTALLYSGSRQLEIIDFHYGSGHYGDSVKHSGKAHRFNLRQKIEVDLAHMSPEVNEIYFTLSGNGSARGRIFESHLRDFIDPTVKLVDKFGEELGAYISDSQEDGDKQAVILCSAIKEYEQWTVEVLDQKCQGNHRNYSPIERAIADIRERRRGLRMN